MVIRARIASLELCLWGELRGSDSMTSSTPLYAIEGGDVFTPTGDLREVITRSKKTPAFVKNAGIHTFSKQTEMEPT